MAELGKGAAVAITSADIAALAESLGVHPAHIEAVAEVESQGFGWFPDGRIKILFEKHQFYKRLPESKRANASKSGLARKSWISPKNGGYKDQAAPDQRYKLLERAIRMDEDAAYQSISIGTYQIMGFNHKTCGYPTAKAMFGAFCASEANQLRAFARFLEKNSLVPALRKGQWDVIEAGYNGGGLNGAYARKMARAADRLRAGKWSQWGATPLKPAPRPEPVTPPPPPPPPPKPPVESRARGIVGLVVLLATMIAAGAAALWQHVANFFGGLF